MRFPVMCTTREDARSGHDLAIERMTIGIAHVATERIYEWKATAKDGSHEIETIVECIDMGEAQNFCHTLKSIDFLCVVNILDIVHTHGKDNSIDDLMKFVLNDCFGSLKCLLNFDFDFDNGLHVGNVLGSDKEYTC